MGARPFSNRDCAMAVTNSAPCIGPRGPTAGDAQKAAKAGSFTARWLRPASASSVNRNGAPAMGSETNFTAAMTGALVT